MILFVGGMGTPSGLELPTRNPAQGSLMLSFTNSNAKIMVGIHAQVKYW